MTPIVLERIMFDYTGGQECSNKDHNNFYIFVVACFFCLNLISIFTYATSKELFEYWICILKFLPRGSEEG